MAKERLCRLLVLVLVLVLVLLLVGNGPLVTPSCPYSSTRSPNASIGTSFPLFV